MTTARTLFEFDHSYAREVPGLSLPWTAAAVPAPELLVLAATARRRSGRDALGSMALVPTVLALALWWFNDHGLPIGELLTHSQISADGGNWAAFENHTPVTG